MYCYVDIQELEMAQKLGSKFQSTCRFYYWIMILNSFFFRFNDLKLFIV